jgi:deazaflavin-dependent oxidoreductase (nitroreductase family)
MPIPEGEQTWNAGTIADFRAHEGRITTGPLAGSNLLLMTSSGVRSGRPRTAPLGYTRDGERYIVVGSNSGRDEQAEWVANILAHPIVTVEVGTETFQARTEVTQGPERRRLLDAHIEAIPIFGRYETMTTRELPVVLLERIDPD